jgi:hypothetical protein
MDPSPHLHGIRSNLNFDLSFASYLHHFEIWISHLRGICSVLEFGSVIRVVFATFWSLDLSS